jgi:hypothetical protein
MLAQKKTPGRGAPACEGWSFATESHQSKRTIIVGNPAEGSKAEPSGASESLTVAQCQAMRAAALRFGYALTWAMLPRLGLRWYARRNGAAPVVLGNTAGAHRFLSLHSRWIERPSLGQTQADRWLAQKTRSQSRRPLRRKVPA